MVYFMPDDDRNNAIINYADARFEIRPYPKHDDLLQITNFVKELGYNFNFSFKQYSLEDVQAKLREEGPQAFLRIVRHMEDISGKTTFKKATAFVAERLVKLAPASELIIIDPYLFPDRPQLGEQEYGKFLAELIAPILAPDASVTCLVNRKVNRDVQTVTEDHLRTLVPDATLQAKETEDFHDRFWIADRKRGVVVGSSFNGLGKRIFLVDTLSKPDLEAILEAVTA